MVFGMGNRVGQNYLFNYVDPSPISISYVGVASGSAGVSAQWTIPAEFFTNSKKHLLIYVTYKDWCVDVVMAESDT